VFGCEQTFDGGTAALAGPVDLELGDQFNGFAFPLLGD
jgi:hypothetical protein